MRGALILAKDINIPIIPVILPDVPQLSDHFLLPLFLRARTVVDLRPHLSDAGLESLQWGITGCKSDAGNRTFSGETFAVAEMQRSLSVKFDVSPRVLHENIISVRHLRRRARVITSGTKQFRLIMNALISQQHTPLDRGKVLDTFEGTWEILKDPYERVITHAAYLESLGQIESMLAVLEKPRFNGKEESARVLYEAIACEKLDDIGRAQKLLRRILDTEKQKDLLRAAQFNTHVCYEKVADFANVNFEAFFLDQRNAFVDQERLSDKAVAMHMIVCMERGDPFVHKKLLAASLDYLKGKSVVGYAKTLLTKIQFEKSVLTDISAKSILESVDQLDANSRRAILIRVSEYLPSEARNLRDLIFESLQNDRHESESVDKWMRSLNRSESGDEPA